MEHETDCVRLGVLDNDPFALAMIAGMFKGRRDVKIMWTARNAAPAVQLCMNPATRPETLLVDMGLEGMSGIDVCVQIRRFLPDIRFIGMTAYSPDVYEADARDAGMECVLPKEDFPAVIGAVRGDLPIRKIHVNHNEDRGIGLSPRELEIMRCFSEGAAAKEVMAKLGISKGTLGSYESRAVRKLGARNRTEAVALCVRMHLFG